jgi:hypothetical protein
LGLPVADRVAIDALVVAVLARQLQCGFVGFQTGGAEESVGQARAFHQQLGQFLLAGHVVVIAAVDHVCHLLLQRLHQFGVAMPQGVHGDAGQRIQVFLAVDVPDTAALAVRHGDREAPVGVHHMGRRRDDGSGFHGETPGTLGAQNKAAQRRLSR